MTIQLNALIMENQALKDKIKVLEYEIRELKKMIRRLKGLE